MTHTFSIDILTLWWCLTDLKHSLIETALLTEVAGREFCDLSSSFSPAPVVVSFEARLSDLSEGIPRYLFLSICTDVHEIFIMHTSLKWKDIDRKQFVNTQKEH